jgi:hypothetical protein
MMPAYIICYDLIKRKDYPELFKAIKALGSWWHCLDSTWIVVNDGPSTTIRNTLQKHIDADDRLLVAKLSGEAAWIHLDKECSDWLMKNL